MMYPSSRIPDHLAAEVLAEATRLHAQMTSGYSLEDLQLAGLEARIPPELIQQAVKNVEERHSLKRAKRQQSQQYIRQQIQKGISGGIKLLIPSVIVSGIFIARPYIEPVISGFVSRNFQQKVEEAPSKLTTLAVKEGKLEYFIDAKGLSIAVNNAYNMSINATIGTDGYESLEIRDGKVGNVYNYKGIYNYQIKIIEVNNFPVQRVVFQIDQQGQQSQTPIQRLEAKIKQLQEQPIRLQKQIEAVQIEKDSIRYQLEQKERDLKIQRDSNQEQLQKKDKQLQELREENARLKLAPQNQNQINKTPVSYNNKPGAKPHSNSQQAIDSNQNIANPVQLPKLMLPEDFRNAVIKKTMDEVTQAFGKPDLISDLGVVVFWRYYNKLQDPNNSYITSASLRFENGIVSNVDFN
ncbi:LemA family protein [Calothrix sp. NIES-4071]|nr:LemA family protein [Calothrix sp. NIES-4071]BAZ61895.1 LemA family protein [Calothrix sp. NIES-4105]